MSLNRIVSSLVLLALLIGGCAGSQVSPRDSARLAGSATTQPTSIAELDQLNYAFADRYFMVVGSAVDAIKKDNNDPNERRIAHRIKLNGVMALNDIVSSNDPYSATLDLIVAVTLQSHVWIDENRANVTFGDRAPLIIRALNDMRREAWELAARVMTQDELALLDYLIIEWRRENPDVDQVAFVKFDAFANARSSQLLAELKSGGGLLAPLRETNAELHEYRRLAERAFWYSKRAPSVAAIQAEAASTEILAAPEIRALLATIDRLSATAQSVGATIDMLPKTAASERQAWLAELDARDQQFSRIYGNTHTLMQDGQTLVRDADKLSSGLQNTLTTLQQALTTADGVMVRFYGPTTLPAGTPPAKPFDINDYGAVAGKLSDIVAGLNKLASSADVASRATPWTQALQDVSDAADRRVERVFHRVYIAIGLLLVAAVIYLLLSRLLPPRPLGRA